MLKKDFLLFLRCEVFGRCVKEIVILDGGG